MARSRGRRTSASSGCEPHGYSSSGCQPRRDRAPGVRHVPPAGPGHRRRLHRPGRRRAARRRGRRPGAAAQDQRLSQRRGHHRRGPRRRCRRDPPRLRVPLGERRFRGRRPGRRTDLDRPAGGRGAGNGLQDRGQEADGLRRRARSRRARSRHGHPGAAAGAGQGLRGRGRAGHAGGTRIVRPASRSRGGAPRSAVRVRRSDGVLRALPAHRPPHRGSSHGRHPRHGVGRRGTRVLDSAPPPEDHRGGPLPAGGAHPGHARQAVRRGATRRRRDRLHRRRDGGVPGRRRWRVLLPGDEHPATGRAPGHRRDDRARPGGAAARGGRRSPPRRRTSRRPGSFDRGQALRGGSRTRVAAPGRCGARVRGALRASRVRLAGTTDRHPAGFGDRRWIHRVDPLRPDAGQGHLLRPDTPPGGAGSRRRADPRPGARAAHQPRPAGERVAASSVPRRRHRHSVFRHARPGRTIGAAG